MDKAASRVRDQGKENMNGHKEDRKVEAELRRRESEVAHLERRLKSSKENARAMAAEAEAEKRKLEKQIDMMRNELAKKDGHIVALQHQSSAQAAQPSSSSKRGTQDTFDQIAALEQKLEERDREILRLREERDEMQAQLDDKFEELKEREGELSKVRDKGEKAGEKMVQKMARQTEQHLKTIASQARQINQLELDLAKASSKRGSSAGKAGTQRSAAEVEGKEDGGDDGHVWQRMDEGLCTLDNLVQALSNALDGAEGHAEALKNEMLRAQAHSHSLQATEAHNQERWTELVGQHAEEAAKMRADSARAASRIAELSGVVQQLKSEAAQRAAEIGRLEMQLGKAQAEAGALRSKGAAPKTSFSSRADAAVVYSPGGDAEESIAMSEDSSLLATPLKQTEMLENRLIESLQSRLKEEQAKSDQLQKMHELDRSRADQNRTQLHQRVVAQMEELSLQQQTVSDLTAALRELQAELDDSRQSLLTAKKALAEQTEQGRKRDVELEQSKDKCAGLASQLAQLRQREAETPIKRQLDSSGMADTPIRSLGAVDTGSPSAELELQRQIGSKEAEIEELNVKLQAAQQNVALVRDGMSKKVAQLERRLQEKRDECRQHRQALGLPTVSPPDSPPLSAAAQWPSPAMSAIRRRSAQSPDEQGQEHKGDGERGSEVKWLRSKVKELEEERKQQEKKMEEAMRELTLQLSDIEQGFRNKDAEVQRLSAALEGYESNPLLAGGRDQQGEARVRELERQLQKSQEQVGQLERAVMVAEEAVKGMKRQAPMLLDQSVSWEVARWPAGHDASAIRAGGGDETARARLEEELEERERRIAELEELVREQGQMAQDFEMERVDLITRMDPHGWEEKRNVALKRMSEEVAQLRQEAADKDQDIELLTSKVQRVSEILKGLREDSKNTLRYKDQLIADLTHAMHSRSAHTDSAGHASLLNALSPDTATLKALVPATVDAAAQELNTPGRMDRSLDVGASMVDRSTAAAPVGVDRSMVTEQGVLSTVGGVKDQSMITDARGSPERLTDAEKAELVARMMQDQEQLRAQNELLQAQNASLARELVSQTEVASTPKPSLAGEEGGGGNAATPPPLQNRTVAALKGEPKQTAVQSLDSWKGTPPGITPHKARVINGASSEDSPLPPPSFTVLSSMEEVHKQRIGGLERENAELREQLAACKLEAAAQEHKLQYLQSRLPDAQHTNGLNGVPHVAAGGGRAAGEGGVVNPRAATRGEVFEEAPAEDLQAELERTRECVELLSRDLDEKARDLDEKTRDLEAALQDGQALRHQLASLGGVSGGVAAGKAAREEGERQRVLELAAEVEALREELSLRHEASHTQVAAVPVRLEGLSGAEKNEMIAALKSKVSGLYREVEASEEAVLVLTKKNEILRRNMKAFRDGASSKINLLREQLHDKEEELAEVLREAGAKPQSSREADLAEASHIDAAELQYRLSRMEEHLQQREAEVRQLTLEAARPGRGGGDEDEVEAVERMLIATQQKVVGAHQRASQQEAEVQRVTEALLELRHKFAKQKERLHASATMHAVMEGWMDVVTAARAAGERGVARLAAKVEGRTGDGGQQSGRGLRRESWGQSPGSSTSQERGREGGEGRASGSRQIEVSYIHRDIDRIGGARLGPHSHQASPRR